MDINQKDIVPHTFIEKVATFEFDKFYTSRVRMVCHMVMWIIFTFLIQINLFLGSGLPLGNTLVFTGRSLLCNVSVFYLFFYFVVPKTLLKNRLWLSIISLPFLMMVWLILNHYWLVIIGKHVTFENVYFKNAIIAGERQTFIEVISPKNLLVESILIFYSISPFFFIKIVFDIVRFYSKWFKLAVEKLNLERDFLKAQLNPHFLFNTLNNLYGLSLRNDQRTPQVIVQLSKLMRYTLYESNTVLVPLKKELEFLKNYVLLEKMRYNDTKSIVFNLDDSNISTQMIAPLLTFTFVENGFKYGLQRKNHGFLKIDVSFDNNIFQFRITNDKEENRRKQEFNGIGTVNIKQEFNGIGTVNIRKRLQLLYPEKYELKIEDRGKIFFVDMKLNLQ